MQLHIYKDGQELSYAVADWITGQIADTLEKQDRFTIALSGGSTPKVLHKILAASPYKEKIDWTKLHVFWGDERAVPFGDDRNNAKMAYDTLLDKVSVPASQVHVMRTDIPPEQSAAEYGKILRGYFPLLINSNSQNQHSPLTIDHSSLTTPSSLAAGHSPLTTGHSPLTTHHSSLTPHPSASNSFDLVLLGMGDDGHTLSLLPGTEVVHEEKAWAIAYFLKAQDMYRITLTKTIVNSAARVAFLTTGSGKAHALKEVLKGAYNPDLYPSQEIKPTNGELHWFVDKAAASELEE